MAEAEEQAPVSPQSEGRSGAGEEAPERTPESGASLGAGEPATSPAGSPGTEDPAGDAKKKSNGAAGRVWRAGVWRDRAEMGGSEGQSAVRAGGCGPARPEAAAINGRSVPS